MDWHPEDIKSAIRKRGGNLTSLGAAAGVSGQAITAALSVRSSERLERAIANFIGVSPQEIWPSRYDAKGQRILLRARSERERAAA